MRFLTRAPARAAVLAGLLLTGCSGSDDGPASPSGRTPYSWSLDLNLSGDAVLAGIKEDTAATAAAQGEITGKVNGFDASVAEDTLRFVNVEHGFLVKAPLDKDGAFRFDAIDLLGGLEGSMTILIWIRAKSAVHAPQPDTLTLELERP